MFGTCTASSGITIFNETYITSCCQTDNCNSVPIEPKVTSCYVGEKTIVNLKNQTILKNSISKLNCVSPKNQICMTYYTAYNDSQINMTSASYLCTDSCIAGMDSYGSLTKCCQSNNCNCPDNTICSGSVSFSYACIILIMSIVISTKFI